MLSAAEISLYGRICTLSYNLNIIPIRWDAITEELSKSTLTLKQRLNILSRIFSLAYFMFALFRLYTAYKEFGVSYPIQYPAFHVFNLFLHLFTVMFETVIGAYTEEIIYLSNQLLKANKDYGIIRPNHS